MNRTTKPLVAAALTAAIGVVLAGATPALAATPTPTPGVVVYIADPNAPGGLPTTGPGQVAPTAVPTLPSTPAATSTPTAAATATPTTAATATKTAPPATATVAQPTATAPQPTAASTQVAGATVPPPKVGNGGPVSQSHPSPFLGLGAMLTAAGILLASAWAGVKRSRR